jgi:1-acyl-sn-glycerol-3-phosphate acyltransferase
MSNSLVAALSYVVFAVVLLLAVPLMAVVWLLCRPFDRNGRIVGLTLRRIAQVISSTYPGWSMRLQDVPVIAPGQPFIAVANHESILDIFLVSRAPWEMKWMAKQSLFKIPWLGLLFRMSGDIPVDRADKGSGSRALQRARAYVEAGMPVMMFPEGTRSRTGTLLPFKPGAFKLALDTGLPILPIAVYGTASGMPVDSPWIRPTRAVARFLPMVQVDGLTADDLPQLIETVRDRIQKARDELAAQVAAQPRAACFERVA